MREQAVSLQRDELLAATSAVAASVALISTRGPAGRLLHLTASVMPVRDEGDAESSVTLVMALPAAVAGVASANGDVTVCVLAAGSQDLAEWVSRADGVVVPEADAESDVEVGSAQLHDELIDTERGLVPRESVATLRCRITSMLPLPSHTVIVSDVIEATSTPHHEPLLFLRDTYRHVEELPASMFPMFTFATPRPERIETAR